jgi:hypothetical protein
MKQKMMNAVAYNKPFLRASCPGSVWNTITQGKSCMWPMYAPSGGERGACVPVNIRIMGFLSMEVTRIDNHTAVDSKTQDVTLHC